MRLHRFYYNNKIGTDKLFTIESQELSDQIKKVFRLKSGDSLIVFDGSGYDHECKIVDFTPCGVKFEVTKVTDSLFMPERKVFLYASVVKKDNFEWIVEKATELGVTNIIPVISERSEKKSLNLERLIKISVEASEQSGRGDVVNIGGIITLNEALENLRQQINIKKIVFHTGSAEILTPKKFHNENVAIFIGPEGGWAPKEIELFNQNKFEIYSLGKTILRAETAVVSALAIV